MFFCHTCHIVILVIQIVNILGWYTTYFDVTESLGWLDNLQILCTLMRLATCE